MRDTDLPAYFVIMLPPVACDRCLQRRACVSLDLWNRRSNDQADPRTSLHSDRQEEEEEGRTQLCTFDFLLMPNRILEGLTENSDFITR